ncbi:MAG: hypothetical protein JWO76_954 [Nocardioides sp.]|jgi:hypothetical protein|nr:hypothetical protein [Nocardioides sp.]
MESEARQLGAGHFGSRRRGAAALSRALLVLGALIVVLAVGQASGRAAPTGNYRPDLVADTLRLGCYPLPGGVRLDFPYVVRSDGDHPTASGERRSLVLHWSLLDREGVRDRLRDAFVRAGFEEVGRGTPSELSLARAEPGGRVTRVDARLTELDNLSPDPIVRGVLELDLPVVGLSSRSPDCENPFVTKRFDVPR